MQKAALFRRTKSEETTPAAAPPKPGGKGRPTPTRREAEAAAKARAKGAADKKAAAKQLRRSRLEQNTKMREGMKTGDERFLPARDQGKVRRFIRDRVDSRLSAAEFLLPLLIVIMVLTYSGSPTQNRYGQSLWMVTIACLIHGSGSDPAHSGFLEQFSNTPGSDRIASNGHPPEVRRAVLRAARAADRVRPPPGADAVHVPA